MKILSLFHPLFQLLVFAVGIFNARMGLTRKDFTWPRHRNFGLLYYAMATLGLVGGLLVNRLLRTAGIGLDLGSHLPVAFFMVFIFLLAGALGFLIRLGPTMRKILMPTHKYLNFLSLLLFAYQGITGVMALLGSFFS